MKYYHDNHNLLYDCKTLFWLKSFVWRGVMECSAVSSTFDGSCRQIQKVKQNADLLSREILSKQRWMRELLLPHFELSPESDLIMQEHVADSTIEGLSE